MIGLAHHRVVRPSSVAASRFEPIAVAACIVRDPDGRVLMARRRPDQMSPGFWEVPGGKVEPGETAIDAAIRELREETGLDGSRLTQLTQYAHQFPSRRINLVVFEAQCWSGHAHGCENQALDWVRPDIPQVGPILESNRKVLRLLAMPRSVICVDPPRTDVAIWASDVAKRALTSGAGAAFFACGVLPAAQQIALGGRLRAALKPQGVALWMDSTPQIAARAGAELAARAGVGPRSSEIIQAAMTTDGSHISNAEVLISANNADLESHSGPIYRRHEDEEFGASFRLIDDT